MGARVDFCLDVGWVLVLSYRHVWYIPSVEQPIMISYVRWEWLLDFSLGHQHERARGRMVMASPLSLAIDTVTVLCIAVYCYLVLSRVRSGPLVQKPTSVPFLSSCAYMWGVSCAGVPKSTQASTTTCLRKIFRAYAVQ